MDVEEVHFFLLWLRRVLKQISPWGSFSMKPPEIEPSFLIIILVVLNNMVVIVTAHLQG
jgi:hypothetical protein